MITLVLSACTSSDEGGEGNGGDNFDRSAMLENLADNIIIPAYQNFSADVTALKNATSSFIATTNEDNLNTLREAWADAYISWQSVGMYEIGKAEELEFINFMNLYPVSISNIENNINTETYNLASAQLQDEQGFGALDYLINGLADTDADILAFYTGSTNGSKYRNYLTALVERMNMLTNEVVTSWTNGYRDTFVNNGGSSVTSSVDKIANDFIFYYEKHLRAGKIAIPAGVFATETFPEKVEAVYKGDFSKTLFNASLSAMQDFFNGKHFDSNTTGESFRTYLDFLNTIKGGEDLPKIINDQFNTARTTASGLNDNFSEQVKSNNNLMLETYNELQKNVVHIKVDMLQALNIIVDFQDADGD
ncbi:imelysin family protein [Aquimarina gracilis]